MRGLALPKGTRDLLCFVLLLLFSWCTCCADTDRSLPSRCGTTACSSAGCQSSSSPVPFWIRWQRLVDSSGKTCDRCGLTEQAVEEAHRLLTASLTPLGFRVQMTKSVLEPKAFAKDPSASNRIWVGGFPIEDLLGASVTRSRCSSVCGDSDCRALSVSGRTFDGIPAALIVKAGLVAAARMLPLSGERASAGAKPCCPR